jgi:hypothetical protein
MSRDIGVWVLRGVIGPCIISWFIWLPEPGLDHNIEANVRDTAAKETVLVAVREK